MRLRVVVLILAACLTAAAQMKLSVDQLVSFLRSSIKLKQEDRQVADYVRKIKLTNRLDARTIEELQGEGLGPKTVQALGDLREASTGLPAAPPPGLAPPPKPVMPPPSDAEQKRVLGQATEYAVNYVKRLPDFICSQVTRRYVDPTGRESWLKQDEILERLSYSEQHEEYKVVMVNNRLMDIPHDKLGGSATSSGEFGSILKEIFEPRSETTFGWERWTTLRKRLTYVFNYHVPQARSTYRITHFVTPNSSEGAQSVVPGYRGLVYVDKENFKVMKITLEAENLPPGFPIRQVNLSLDYGPARIGDSDYVLPLQAELRSSGDNRFQVKNDIEFRMYRKFGADTTIKFDTPEPLPETDLKEQPVK
jgi:hypothetical protein